MMAIVTHNLLRRCGHNESISLDESGPYYAGKLERIARTRCKECADKLRAKDQAAAAARKEKRHQEKLAAIRRHKERNQAKLDGERAAREAQTQGQGQQRRVKLKRIRIEILFE